MYYNKLLLLLLLPLPPPPTSSSSSSLFLLLPLPPPLRLLLLPLFFFFFFSSSSSSCQPHSQPPTWRRTRVSLFVWDITFELSGMRGPTLPPTIAHRIIWPCKPHHCLKVAIPFGGGGMWMINNYTINWHSYTIIYHYLICGLFSTCFFSLTTTEIQSWAQQMR